MNNLFKENGFLSDYGVSETKKIREEVSNLLQKHNLSNDEKQTLLCVLKALVSEELLKQ